MVDSRPSSASQTKRTRTAQKADIPSEDDPVSRLDHLGRATIEKLADLEAAAAQANIDLTEWALEVRLEVT